MLRILDVAPQLVFTTCGYDVSQDLAVKLPKESLALSDLRLDDPMDVEGEVNRLLGDGHYGKPMKGPPDNSQLYNFANKLREINKVAAPLVDVRASFPSWRFLEWFPSSFREAARAVTFSHMHFDESQEAINGRIKALIILGETAASIMKSIALHARR